MARVLSSPYIPQVPTPKQWAFLLCDSLEAFFGGAAGPGKSSALLMAALMYVDQPNYAALLLRRTYADLSLPEALMDRAAQWLRNTDARWNAQTKTWHFPSGATLTFGYLENEGDKYRYQGAAFQFVGFDELTQFTETQYGYLFSRLRKLEGSEVPLRMRAAANPGGVGHEWVKNRFIGAEAKRNRRVFVPAKMTDNPHLDQKSYLESLNRLDPVTRAQLLNGNWDVIPSGNMFGRKMFKLHEFDPAPRLVRVWDLAGTVPSDSNPDPDYTATALGGLDGLELKYSEVRRFRASPADVKDNIVQTAKADGRHVPIYVEQEPGSAGKFVISDLQAALLGFTLVPYPKGGLGDKVTRARPLSAHGDIRGIHLHSSIPDLSGLLTRLEAFPSPGIHDDEVDVMADLYQIVSEGFVNLAPEQAARWAGI